MGLKITDEELKPVQSGTALRFTVMLYLDEAETLGTWTKGYMAFRNEKGELDIKPPVTPLNLRGKRIKYYGTGLTPDLAAHIRDYVEKTWGKQLQPNPDWNDERKAQKQRQKEEGWAL